MVKTINFKDRVNNNKGVAILFAILLVSVVLTVGLTLLNITYRQLVLSSLAQESQFAFYAADSARNCARHYDSILDNQGSPTIRPFGYFDLVGGSLNYNLGSGSPNCGFQVFNFEAPTLGDFPIASFGVVLNDGTRSTCAEVKVLKDNTSAPTPNPLTNEVLGRGKTLIISRGYNNYNNGGVFPCYAQSDRTVERASTMIY